MTPFVLNVFLIANLFVATCHGGILGFIGGSGPCLLLCNAAYATCLVGGTTIAGKTDRKSLQTLNHFVAI